MLARFQILFSLFALFLSGAFAVSNTTFISQPSVIVTAHISTGTGSGVTTANSTLLITPTPTASSTASPSLVGTNGAAANAGYLNAAVVGAVALGAAFVSL